jgi:hypothetical protein
MVEIVGDAQHNILELAKILGVSTEMATTFVSEGHVVFSEEKRHTFLRFHDVYKSLRKTKAGQTAAATA